MIWFLQNIKDIPGFCKILKTIRILQNIKNNPGFCKTSKIIRDFANIKNNPGFAKYYANILRFIQILFQMQARPKMMHKSG